MGAGLAAGAFTNSATIGTAGDAIGRLGLPEAQATALSAKTIRHPQTKRHQVTAPLLSKWLLQIPSQTALPIRKWGSFLPGNGVGGAPAQDLVPDDHLPEVNDDRKGQQRPDHCRIPAALLGDDDGVGALARVHFSEQRGTFL